MTAPTQETDAFEGMDDDSVIEAATTELMDDTPADVNTDDVLTDDNTDDAPDAAPVDAATVEEVPPAVPFAVNVWGQPYQLPGSTFDPKNRAIAFASDKDFDRARQLLTKGREFETRGRQEIQQLRSELQRRDNEPDEEKVQAQVYLQEFKALMTMSEQELYDFCTNARMNWPKIEAKADRAYAERLREQARTANAPPEPDREAIVEEATRGASQFIQSTLANEAWATPEVRDELTAILSNPRMLSQFVYRTDRDVPEYGVRAGQWVADWDRAGELLADLQKPYQRAATATQAATQRVQTTQAVAQTNARALARAKPTNTPVAPQKKAAPPRQRPQDVVKDAMSVWREMNAR